MPWSTRELAERAGTTVNAVRHYHRIGLLEEAERRHNGYKQYEVRHLVSLLRIRRLADLGMPLSQIGDVSAGADITPETLRNLDAELQESIERLEKARAGIAVILRDNVPADSPAGFESVASRLSETGRGPPRSVQPGAAGRPRACAHHRERARADDAGIRKPGRLLRGPQR